MAKEPSELTQLGIQGLKQEFMGQKEQTGPGETQLIPRELWKVLGRKDRVSSGQTQTWEWGWGGGRDVSQSTLQGGVEISVAVVMDSLRQAEAAQVKEESVGPPKFSVLRGALGLFFFSFYGLGFGACFFGGMLDSGFYRVVCLFV